MPNTRPYPSGLTKQERLLCPSSCIFWSVNEQAEFSLSLAAFNLNSDYLTLKVVNSKERFVLPFGSEEKQLLLIDRVRRRSAVENSRSTTALSSL
ncbi:hypothetical protein T4B_5839 [Trichinella pseudospiralis]|uniref:Uncharacterized protein n=1 Tax=Trichinella pseudospiralis TaxID=6337 RepID=A0A0V1IYN9_TRIPS|nr:hypothetical protein T4B_5839 [Trichinella pseudospiralis]